MLGWIFALEKADGGPEMTKSMDHGRDACSDAGPASLAVSARQLLALSREPIGVQLVRQPPTEESGTWAKCMPCQALLRAAQGDTIVLSKENTLCFGGRYHLGFDCAPPWRSEFLCQEEKLFAPYVVPPVDRANADNGYRAFHIRRLDSFERPPSLVVLIGTPWQAMRILGLLAYTRGSYKIDAGFSSTCQTVIERPMRTGRIGVSLIDATARRYSPFGPEEMMVALPYALFEETMANVNKSVHGLAEPEHLRTFPDEPASEKRVCLRK